MTTTMTMKTSLALIAALTGWTWTTMAQTENHHQVVVDIMPSSIPASTSVNYTCNLTDMWTAARHPEQYPSSAHWSSPVIVAHTNQYSMWQDGDLATVGLERLAEFGNTFVIRNEMQQAEFRDEVGTPSVGFTFGGGLQVLDSFQVTTDQRYISSATMVAPSPDWFSGISAFNALSAISDTWYASFSLNAYPWDAGTEAGLIYSFGGTAENPHGPIFQITENTLPTLVNDIFLSPDGSEVLPVTRWDCRIDMEDVPCNAYCQLLIFFRSVFGGPV